jgi:hypothetical protein
MDATEHETKAMGGAIRPSRVDEDSKRREKGRGRGEREGTGEDGV